jgi:hypothetical protein
MQAMLNKGMSVVSVTCDPGMEYCRYNVWGVKEYLGKTTIDEFCDELDKEIEKLWGDESNE